MPISSPVIVKTPADTMKLAGNIAQHCQEGDVIALRGELGAGKTVFARGFIQSLTEEKEVTSPTFNLVKTYQWERAVIWHFDLYRLEALDEAWELGIEEAFQKGISLIEWPERVASLLPSDRLAIDMEFGKEEQTRLITLTGNGEWEQRLREVVS